MNRANKKYSGFTLLEVIITLMIASIIGTAFIQLLGVAMLKSREPMLQLEKTLKLQMIIENITQLYKTKCFKNYNSDKQEFNLQQFQKIISEKSKNNFGFNGQEEIDYNIIANYFVKDIPTDNPNKVKFVRTTNSKEKNILLVTIKLDRKDSESLSVLFTEKLKMEVEKDIKSK